MKLLYSASYDRKMLNRAIAGYCRRAVRERTMIQQPAPENSGLVQFDSLDYVILRNDRQEIIAVYRITNQKQLKRLRYWPKQLRGNK